MRPLQKLQVATPLRPRKRAILVGASRGIGAALARTLAREGYLLVLLARDEARLKSVCDEINARAGETCAVYHIHDVTDFDRIPVLFEQAVAELGGLDLFIYNTGILQPVELDEFNFAKDRAMIETNLLGAMAWLNPAAAFFRNLRRGHIVGIGSVAGDRGRIGAPAYNTSKAGLHTYLEALRNRLTRHGVHVLTVKPGFVDTDMLKQASTKGKFLVSSAEQAAEGIWRAICARRQTVYISAPWGLIMHIIRHIPSFIFRRMSF